MKSSTAVSYIPSAYKLAYALLGDPAAASNAVLEAFDGIDGFLRRQEKNREGALNPTKPYFGEIETFQYLLYEELEEAEVRQERECQRTNKRLDDQTMIVRYLKCVVYNSIINRPYYLAVAIGSLLYGYDWKATQDLHDLVIQDHDEAKTQNKKNDRLRDLKEDLIERFGNLLPYSIDGRGEKKFNLRPPTDELFSLVQVCLSLLVPWGSEHVLPDTLASANTSIPAFRPMQGQDAENDHEEQSMALWKNRSHAFIDPTCFKRLVDVLKVGPLNSRVNIPDFALSRSQDNGGAPSTDLLNLPEPPPEFYEELFGKREERIRRRRDLRAKRFAIVVDEVEIDHFDVEESESFSFEVSRRARLVKVMASDEAGPLVMAKLSLKHYRDELENGEEVQVATELRDGQTIEMTLCPHLNSAHEIQSIAIAGSYRETHPVRSLLLTLRRIKLRSLKLFRFENWTVTTGLKAAGAIAAVLLIVVGIVLWRRSSAVQTAQNTPRELPQPSPGASGGTASSSWPGSSPAPQETPSPEIAQESTGSPYVINDRNGIISIPRNGSSNEVQVLGLDGYAPSVRSGVVKAFDNEGRNIFINSLIGIQQNDQTLGATAEAKRIVVKAPNGEIVRTRTPTLKWSSNLGRHQFLIKIYDDAPDKRSSPPLKSEVAATNEWTVSQPLERGRTYLWQVSAIPLAGETETSLPRTAEGRFRIISGSDLAEIAQAEKVTPRSRLALAVEYAKVGLLSEAERELNALLKKNFNSKVIRNLITKVHEAQRRRVEAR